MGVATGIGESLASRIGHKLSFLVLLGLRGKPSQLVVGQGVKRLTVRLFPTADVGNQAVHDRFLGLFVHNELLFATRLIFVYVNTAAVIDGAGTYLIWQNCQVIGAVVARDEIIRLAVVRRSTIRRRLVVGEQTCTQFNRLTHFQRVQHAIVYPSRSLHVEPRLGGQLATLELGMKDVTHALLLQHTGAAGRHVLTVVRRMQHH